MIFEISVIWCKICIYAALLNNTRWEDLPRNRLLKCCVSASNTVVKSHITVIHIKGNGQSSLLQVSSHTLVMY